MRCTGHFFGSAAEAMRGIFAPLVRELPAKDRVLLCMHTAVVPVPHEELTTPPPADPSDSHVTRLQRIRQRGALRVGCVVDNLPFSFRNEAGDLVGFDIDMAHLLASELDCKLLLVPLTPEQFSTELDGDTIDLAMSGIAMTTDRLQTATFTRPYMWVSMSLMVPDYRRSEFIHLEKIRRMTDLRVAVMPSRRFGEQLVRAFPLAEVVTIQSPREFFVNPALGADAMLISAESGSAWTLIYPGFTPVIPQPQAYRVPLAYPVAAHDNAFADFMSQWIELKSASPQYTQMYDYWIFGRGHQEKPPRWSILRNVLGWVR